MDFDAKFEDGLNYADFLETYGSPAERKNWQAVHVRVRLTEAHRELLQSFVRDMKVLVTAGAWCGDCVNQCPILARFAEQNDCIRLRFFDRDEESQLAQALSICGAPRVPAVLFLSEDGHPCGRYGDRTLSKYRSMAGVGDPQGDPLSAVTQEWLNEFERIQWMLRTSSRLRKLHGD
ncbi:MAG: thioredoxin family protein [Planctomycetaceae bacterium]